MDYSDTHLSFSLWKDILDGFQNATVSSDGVSVRLIIIDYLSFEAAT